MAGIVDTIIVTRKGQITIPIDIWRELGFEEGEQLYVERAGDTIVIRRPVSVVERTAGVFAGYRLPTPLTSGEERESYERGVAEEADDYE